VEAAKILRKHLNPFIQYRELGEETVSAEAGAEEGPVSVVDKDLQERLSLPISQLDLSVRASNCLESAKVTTVGELARMSEAELLKVRSFGRTSLREVKRKLADLGLSLGMNVPAGEGQGGGEESGNPTRGDDAVAAGVTMG
jgi:DNA-directed RNA polymerase subunit alpha